MENTPSSNVHKQEIFDECCTPEGNLSFTKINEFKKRMEGYCNIALIGISGSGKSSLINNLLDFSFVRDNAKLANIKHEISMCKHTNRETCNHTYAPIGTTEGLTVPTPYVLKDTTICLWDLPGFGAELYPSADIHWDQLFAEQYDAFLFVYSDNRAHPEHKNMIGKLLNTQKPVIWIRTFFDASARGMDASEEENEKVVSREFLQQMGVHDPHIYCMSALYNPNCDSNEFSYDRNRVKDAIAQITPTGAFSKWFQQVVEELIQLKYNSLKNTIYLTLVGSANTSAVSSAIPIVGPIWAKQVHDQQVKVFRDKASQIYGFADSAEKLDENSKQKLKYIEHTKVTQAANLMFEVCASCFFGYGSAISMGFSIGGLAQRMLRTNEIYRDAALQLVRKSVQHEY